MGDVFAVEGFTGPGRRTKLFETNVNEIGFNFKKKVITIITRDGNYGTYDLVPTTSIEIDTDGEQFVLSIKTKKEFETEEETKRNHEARAKEVEALAKKLIDQHEKEVEEARDHDRKQAADGSSEGSSKEGGAKAVQPAVPAAVAAKGTK